jgi:hypothetical protein
LREERLRHAEAPAEGAEFGAGHRLRGLSLPEDDD